MKKLITIFATALALGVNAQTDTSNYSYFTKNTLNGTLYGIKNKNTNKIVIPAECSDVAICNYAEKGMFGFVKNNKWGMIDTSGKIIIKPIYDGISFFVEDRAFAMVNQKYGVIDKAGKVLTPFHYDNFEDFNDGISRVVINEQFGFIDKTGKQVIPCKYKEAYTAYGLILIYLQTWENYYDKVTTQGGKEVERTHVGSSDKLPLIYNNSGILIYKGKDSEKVKFTESKNIIISKYNSYDYTTSSKMLNQTGKEILPYSKNYQLEIYDYWIRIKFAGERYNNYGILDFDGKEVLPPNFSAISDYDFNNGELAKVSFNDGTFFYIDYSGKCIEFENVKCPE